MFKKIGRNPPKSCKVPWGLKRPRCAGRRPRYLQGLLYLMEMNAEDTDCFVSTVLNSSLFFLLN